MELATLILIAAVFLAVILILLLLARNDSKPQDRDWPKTHRPEFKPPEIIPPPERRAGIRGEEAAEELIRSVLRPEDALFTNVGIEYEEKLAELDCVVVNKYGVFIFEVKNYSGTLYGGVKDTYWEKMHVSEVGNTYWKTVRNPIGQVKRQIYLLANYLKYYGVNVWVEGFALVLDEENKRGRLLRIDFASVSDSGNLQEEIGRAVHTWGRNRLNRETVERIKELME